MHVAREWSELRRVESATDCSDCLDRGPNEAAVAVAHGLPDVIWHLLTTGEPFSDLGADHYQRRRAPDRVARRFLRELEALGHTVTITPAA